MVICGTLVFGTLSLWVLVPRMAPAMQPPSFMPYDASRSSMMPHNDDGIPHHVGVFNLLSDFQCGRHDPVTNRRIDYPFLETSPAAHRVFVDIGLKDGTETLAAAASGYVVYSFEPVKQYCNNTRRELQKRRIDFVDVKLHRDGTMIHPKLPAPKAGRGIVYLFCVAAGARHEWRTFYKDGYGSSFHDQQAKDNAAQGVKRLNGDGKSKAIEVQVVPISDYITESVYFLKMDTQGHEVDVLEGANRLFEAHTVRMVALEFWPKGLQMAGRSPQDIFRILSDKLRFVCFDYDRKYRPLHPEQSAEYDKRYADLEEDAETRRGGSKQGNRWGWYTDLVCLNNQKAYTYDPSIHR
eukprot:CAMPEP_0198215456 /NCGR_PEP_ID=MMETSP1445-20131203/50017_1 /TAXON_ID=36898 /ORGANISM="Pyramimonas sp., Strain CCMP2087" /LENGTH=351 /DNA_ID=CAMNT_0043891183 /DNA_START=385 /DNA_END=1440 /DNA_ORIENTATION=-